MALVISMGLPGVGKSTVLNGEHKTLNVKGALEQRPEWRQLNVGTLMHEDIRGRPGFEGIGRDDMRKLVPKDVQVDAQKRAMETIAKISHEEPLAFLDTHCSIRQADGTFLRGLPEWFLQSAEVRAFIYVTTTADQLRERRAADPTRARDADDVVQHEAVNLEFLKQYAAATGAPIFVVFNNKGRDALEAAVTRIVQVLDSVQKSVSVEARQE